MRHFFVPFGLKPQKPEDGVRYADTNDRSMAAAIDIALLFYLLNRPSQMITEKVFAYFGQTPLGYDSQINSFAALSQVIWTARYPWVISNGLILLLMGLFVVLCQMAYGTTFGKWLLGLKIVHHKTLEAPARWRYALRFLAYIPACLPLMLGVFWMSFNKQRRGWHDYIAGTVVLSTRPRGWYWGKLKQGYRKLFPSRTVKEAIAEPPAEQCHEDGKPPV